jgi:hypothetical protein
MGAGALARSLASDPQSGARGDHGRSARVHGLDDLGGIDSVEIDRRPPRLTWPSWRWITLRGTRSRAISTAWAWRSWCGAKRRRTPAWLRCGAGGCALRPGSMASHASDRRSRRTASRPATQLDGRARAGAARSPSRGVSVGFDEPETPPFMGKQHSGPSAVIFLGAESDTEVSARTLPLAGWRSTPTTRLAGSCAKAQLGLLHARLCKRVRS